MPADDTPDQVAPTTTNEPQEEDDVEGHNYNLTQDPDFDSRAVSADDDKAPPESQFLV